MFLHHRTFSVLSVAALVIAALFVIALSVNAQHPSQTRAESMTVNAVFSNAQSPLDGFKPTYKSPVMTAPFSFNALAVTWHGTFSHDAPFKLRIRFRGDNKQWSEWQAVDTDEDSETPRSPDPDALVFPERPANAAQYDITYASSDQYQAVTRVTLTAIDSSDKPTPLTRLQRTMNKMLKPLVARADGPTVITRSEWGADESYRFAKDGTTVLWPTEYVTPTTFILHHTAGANGQPDLNAAEAAIRAIYYYHSVSRGWGDIGYNYLIDQAGNIFEGRYGSDGVVAGHAYRDASCASKGPVANLNRGSVGIAVLGNYQTSDELTPATLTALEQFLGTKGRQLGIAPTSTAAFDTRIDMPNVISHRDVDCTTCPGDRFYVNLDTIRAQAQLTYDSTVISEHASLVAQSDTAITLDAGTSRDLWIDVRNDGTQAWVNDPASSPTLEVSVLSAAKSGTWLSDTSVARLATPEVAPGGTGRFDFSITAPTDRLTEAMNFQVRYGDLLITDTPITVTLTMTNLPYAATPAKAQYPIAILSTTRRTATIAYVNDGTQTWQKGDIKLKTWTDGNIPSVFRDSSWGSAYGEFSMTEASVAPGEIAHFTFTVKAPATSGVNASQFSLIKTDKREVPGSLASMLTRVDPRYRLQKVSSSLPVALKKNWSRVVTVTVKNTGKTAWSKSTVLELVNQNGSVSALADRTWPNRNMLRATFKEKQVKPGQTATFTFRIRAPKTAGVYRQQFRVKPSASSAVMENGSWVSLVRIDAR